MCAALRSTRSCVGSISFVFGCSCCCVCCARRLSAVVERSKQNAAKYHGHRHRLPRSHSSTVDRSIVVLELQLSSALPLSCDHGPLLGMVARVGGGTTSCRPWGTFRAAVDVLPLCLLLSPLALLWLLGRSHPVPTTQPGRFSATYRNGLGCERGYRHRRLIFSHPALPASYLSAA